MYACRFRDITLLTVNKYVNLIPSEYSIFDIQYIILLFLDNFLLYICISNQKRILFSNPIVLFMLIYLVMLNDFTFIIG